MASSCPELPDIEELNSRCGFKRPMPGNPLGSLDKYDRHWFVQASTDCEGGAWPHKWTDLLTDPAGVLFKELLARHKKELKLKASICSQALAGLPLVPGAVVPESGVVLLLYPEARRVTLPSEAEVAAFFEEVSSHPISWSFPNAPIPAPLVFVCVHQTVDERCGYCGPRLVARLRQHLGQRSLWGISHVGGHKWAGNVIVASSASVDWFGYVTPEIVPRLVAYLQETPLKSSTLPFHPELAPNFRGRMGLSSTEQKDLFSF